MEKIKKISIAIIIFILILSGFHITQATTVTLEQIAQKFNNCETVKEYEKSRVNLESFLYTK